LWFKATLEKVISTTFPNECAVCGKSIHFSKLLCDECREEVFKGGPRINPEPHKGYELYYYGKYEGRLRELILAYKSGRWRLKKILSELFIRMFEYFPPFPTLVYVPSTLGSVEEKGFDHMEMIAKDLKRKTGMILKNSLKVVSDVRQMGKSAKERRESLGRYTADFPDFTNVTLIDDVYTTGTTVRDAVHALRESGVKDIRVYVIAKGGR
jgi:competence protein ComFC